MTPDFRTPMKAAPGAEHLACRIRHRTYATTLMIPSTIAAPRVAYFPMAGTDPFMAGTDPFRPVHDPFMCDPFLTPFRLYRGLKNR